MIINFQKIIVNFRKIENYREFYKKFKNIVHFIKNLKTL